MMMKKTHPAQGIILIFFMLGLFPNAHADNRTTVIPLSGRIVASTCIYKIPSQIKNLNKISPGDFTDNNMKGEISFNITYSCANEVSKVKIVATGQVDENDNTLYGNSGSAKNVGLRLLSSTGDVLTPDGSQGALVSPSNNGRQLFKAGYIATGRVSAGNFTTMLTFSFDYS